MADVKSRQVVVIGAGPGGYAAAFMAADLGLSVTLIDSATNPGGVCLYRGCIPSKAFLHAARVMQETKEAEAIGLKYGKAKLDIDQLRSWKDGIVEKLTSGLGMLTKQRKIEYIQGIARFQDSHTVKVSPEGGGSRILSFDHAILATGSRNIALPGAPENPALIWDSTSALELREIPPRLLVIGGGFIGLELGSVYASLGSQVTVVEMLPGIMNGADKDLISVFQKTTGKQFESILTQTKVAKLTEKAEGIQIALESKDGNREITVDRVLVSIGRRPNSDGVDLNKTKIETDEKGFIQVKSNRQTDDPLIYAIGDLTGGPLLAHKASHEGRTAAEAISGKKVVFEPAVIPGVVYTHPEIAWCGLTESEAKAQGRNVQIAKFPWAASGRALTMNMTDGLTKLIIDPETERVLGMGIAGPGAGDMISEGALAVEMAALASDVGQTIHPHPTLSETIMEAADVFYGHSTHLYRPKRKQD